jgi:MOSC domain-containing protein YiiM
MRLLSLNVSQPKAVPSRGKIITTEIFKQPIEGRVRLRTLNIGGDGQADLKNHGGKHRAVYAYSIENYDYWKRELGRDDFTYGQFGENFTVEGDARGRRSYRRRVSDGRGACPSERGARPVRQACAQNGHASVPKRFLASERVGFYLRVLEEGEVGAGDSIEWVKTDPEQMTVQEFLHLSYFDEGNLEGVRKVLRIATLPPDWREWFKEVLAKSGEAVHEKGDYGS